MIKNDNKIQLYLLINNFENIKIDREIEYYSPLRLEFSNYKKFSSFNYYVNLKTTKNLVEISIGYELGEIFTINIIDFDSIFLFHYKFLKKFLNLIMVKSGLGLGINTKILRADDFIPYLDLADQFSFEMYEDSIVIRLTEIDNSIFLFWQNEIGILTDKDFKVTGFITWNITKQDKLEICEIVEKRKIKMISNKIMSEKVMLVTSDNKNYFIQNILSLQKVNIIDLLYNGLKRKLIDDRFCIDFAIESLSQGTTNKLLVEIAGLLDHEAHQVEFLLKQNIQNEDEIFVAKGEFYNKIWFYLSAVSDMNEHGIIKS